MKSTFALRLPETGAPGTLTLTLPSLYQWQTPYESFCENRVLLRAVSEAKTFAVAMTQRRSREEQHLAAPRFRLKMCVHHAH